MCRSIAEGGRRCDGSCGEARNAADRARYVAAQGGTVRRYRKRPVPATPAVAPAGVRMQGGWVTGLAADLGHAQALAAIEREHLDSQGRVAPALMPRAMREQWEQLRAQLLRMVDIPPGLILANGLAAPGTRQKLGPAGWERLRKLLAAAYGRPAQR